MEGITDDEFDTWMAALRSGDYEQAVGAMCAVDNAGNRRFCALGVLADTWVKAGKGEWLEPALMGSWMRWRALDGGDSAFSPLNGALSNDVLENNTFRWNDGERMSLDTIADRLEAYKAAVDGVSEGGAQ